ncbi:thiamine phosphate synthase [Isosphaeraceae bacterium EP7]
MTEGFTAGADRALRRAGARASRRGNGLVTPADLLAALADEEESRAVSWLSEAGIAPTQLLDLLGVEGEPGSDAPEEESALPHALDLRAVLSDATSRARQLDRTVQVGTEHLLVAILASVPELSRQIEGLGVDPILWIDRLRDESTGDSSPIPLDSDIPPLDLGEPGLSTDLLRLVDASANRVREGLRVVEDYVRFVLDDASLSRRLKEIRHRFAEACRGLDAEGLTAARDTTGDVGTHIMTASEQSRESPRAVLTANFKRIQEALRTLEEYSKLADVWLAGRFEVLRYDAYTLEKRTIAAVVAHRELGEACLMVLVGGLPTLGDLTWVVGEALAGGADVIQLREKDLSDREWLTRAREVRILTAKARARLIVNDRPDLARLSGADGVHLGQDDVTVRDARRVFGTAGLVGVSTHEIADVERALLDGASYLGVGPVFDSGTKSFDSFAGLEFVRQVAETTTVPWFAIGGIDEENVGAVIEAGARRIAVSGAVVRAEYPRKAVATLRAALDAAR